MGQLALIAQRLAQEADFREQLSRGSAQDAVADLSTEERDALSALRLPLKQTTNQLKERLLKINGPYCGW